MLKHPSLSPRWILAFMLTLGSSQLTVPAARAQDGGPDDSGLFWFFQPDNWEVLVKVLDGCALNDRFWVFAAATTDVEYTLTVTDTVTGKATSYFNPLGTRSPAITDTGALATCSAMTSLVTCVGSGTELCLGERFMVRVDWHDFQDRTGVGRVVPITTFEPRLRIFTNPAIVNVGGEAEVTVVATGGSGQPLGFRRVRLFTNLGTIPKDVDTDVLGEAVTTFTAGLVPGVADITALLGTSEAKEQIQVRDAPAAIVLSVSPATIPGGLDTSIALEAVVSNHQGLPFPNALVVFRVNPAIGRFSSGSNVHFTSALGTISDTLFISEQESSGLTEIRISAEVNSGGSILSNEVLIVVN